MSIAKFIHLRNHSSYSICEGAITISDLVLASKENNMPACAITDSNNMFGALNFTQECLKNGVQPIIGCEINVSAEYNDEKTKNSSLNDVYKLVLLCKNNQGLLNLMEIISNSYVNLKDAYIPQVSIDDISKLSSGLICLTAGLDGEIAKHIIDNQFNKAYKYLKKLKDSFKEDLFIEIIRQKLKNEIEVENNLLDMAKKENIPIVATNNVFFKEIGMAEAHDALLCIDKSVYIADEKRIRSNVNYRFKSDHEMVELFADLPEAIENTIAIAKKCTIHVEEKNPILPKYPYLDGRKEVDVLREIAISGLNKKLKSFVLKDVEEEKHEETKKKYFDRLDYELSIIANMGFEGYFLIVNDFVSWAKKNEIPVGAGRGSGAGSLVAWALLITGLDPIKYGLLFERFLNPERKSMPDFDIDFCKDRRDEVIDYVKNQYGNDRVAQIITFGKLQARMVVRDVGRVLSMPYLQVDNICKLIPNNPANPTTLGEAIESVDELKKLKENDVTIARLIKIALKLEGFYRNAATHAAGIVIGDRPLHKLVSLYKDPSSDLIATQFNMKYVEQVGLVKFDFLGLKTLSIIKMAIDLINTRLNNEKKINIDGIKLDDKKTYEMLARGETIGVFQLESQGMSKVIMQMEVDCLEDIIAAVSLYRPGPMANIPSYVERKHGREEVKYLHPKLEDILKETYGIPVYQEQVMKIAQILSGYSLGDADILRRAMGKKIKSEMKMQEKIFVEGAKKYSNIDNELALEIFREMEAFAGYGFNKSHAAGYAVIAYQTAWLRANYPVEFMAASMSYDLHNTDKIAVFKDDLEKSKIELVYPDVNVCEALFVPDFKNNSISYGLGAIKSVGKIAVDSIVDERKKNGKFKSIEDFFERIPQECANKRMTEGLVKAGAFDSLMANRKKLFENIPNILKHSNAIRDTKNSNQVNLFGEMSSLNNIKMIDFKPWDDKEKLDQEFDSIGFYLSSHPVMEFKNAFKRLSIESSESVLKNRLKSKIVKMAGIVNKKRFITTQKGNDMLIVDASDDKGNFSFLIFGENVNKYKDYINSSMPLYLLCNLSEGREGEVRIVVNYISYLETEASKNVEHVYIHLDNNIDINEIEKSLITIKKLLNDINEVKKCNISFIVQINKDEIEIRWDKKVSFSMDILKAIKSLDGILTVNYLN